MKKNSNKNVKSGKSQRPGALIWKRLIRNKSSMISCIFLVVLLVVSIFAPLILDEGLVTAQDVNALSQAPSLQHLFGTDIYGRDIFIRIIFGARLSLAIGIISVIVGTTLGGVLGATAAFFGGKIDNIIMRILDMFQAIPETLLSMCIVAVLGASVPTLIVAMIVATVPGRARLVRSTVLGVSGHEYIEAAKIAGMSNFKIVLTQMIPNAIGPVIVVATQGVASIMLTASGLSYLGVGIQPPAPEWGALIAAARDYLRIYPYMCVIPGIVISLTALAFNLLGDGLRDAVDPRLKD